MFRQSKKIGQPWQTSAFNRASHNRTIQLAGNPLKANRRAVARRNVPASLAGPCPVAVDFGKAFLMASLAPIPRVNVPQKTPVSTASPVLPGRRMMETCVAHDHICLIYETREEQLAAVVPFLRNGLER